MIFSYILYFFGSSDEGFFAASFIQTRRDVADFGSNNALQESGHTVCGGQVKQTCSLFPLLEQHLLFSRTDFGLPSLLDSGHL